MTGTISKTTQKDFEERIKPFTEALNYSVKNHQPHHNPGSKTIIHTHYFNENGLEIGYWSHYTRTSMIFETPRTWDPEIKRMVKESNL